MADKPFKRGDIVELGDGSIYIVLGPGDGGPQEYRLATIIETHGNPQIGYSHFDVLALGNCNKCKIIGHIEE